MAIPQYKPFDYFLSPIDYRENKKKLEEYGLNCQEVYEYQLVRKNDIERWNKKARIIERLAFSVQFLVSFSIFVLMLYVKQYLYYRWGIEDEDSMANEFLVYSSMGVAVGLIWLLWKHQIVVRMFGLWAIDRYRIKSQNNPIIEKYIDDCNWDTYIKITKPLYEREEKARRNIKSYKMCFCKHINLLDMKKLLTIGIISLLALSSFAQSKRYYCEIKGVEKDFTSGLKIVFDFGNNPIYSAWGGLKSKQKLVDENGNEIPFNSMVDAGNYMSDKGWNFLQVYTSVYGSQAIVHWIFFKDAESPEEAIEGIETKESYNKKHQNVE